MFRTTVIAITGSVGKTTCKECLAAILGARAPTLKTVDNQNDQEGVPRTLLAIRPWHRYAVVEIGTSAPGAIARSARMAKPDVAVVLCVARTHTNRFATLDDTAKEKAQLLRYVSPSGTAILNYDDERVRAMAAGCASRVVWFGRSDNCDYVAERVDSSWPRRLSLTVRSANTRVSIGTQLVGTHWVSSVLGALAASNIRGVPLSTAAIALSTVAPFAARMQPVTLPSGAVMVRDEGSGAPDTFDAMVKVMREARATRRILVVSDLSDSKQKPKRRQRDIGFLAASLSDVAVFVGDHGRHARNAALARGMNPADCHVMPTLKGAADLLRNELRAGDLVFLKGRTTDHLSRVLFAQFGTIGCWTYSCSRRRVCDVCEKLQPEYDLKSVLIASTAVRV